MLLKGTKVVMIGDFFPANPDHEVFEVQMSVSGGSQKGADFRWIHDNVYETRRDVTENEFKKWQKKAQEVGLHLKVKRRNS